jgi:hypothetical protein
MAVGSARTSLKSNRISLTTNGRCDLMLQSIQIDAENVHEVHIFPAVFRCSLHLRVSEDLEISGPHSDEYDDGF